jgi:hypothetical protein
MEEDSGCGREDCWLREVAGRRKREEGERGKVGQRYTFL